MEKNQIAKLIIFPLILAGCIVALDRLLFANVNDDLNSYSQFYKEEKDALDIALVGNSTVREGYIPTYLWRDYKITSRALTSSPTHPEVIKNAIPTIVKEQHPQVMFIDINGFTYQKKADAEFFIKQYYKALPEGDNKTELEEKYPYLIKVKNEFEIFKNHNNFRQQQYWESLVYYDQFKTKGYYPHKVINKVTPISYVEDEKLPLPQDGREYLDEILTICEPYKSSVKFVFGRTPRYITNSDQIEATNMMNWAQEIIEDKGFYFKDFAMNVKDMELDPNSDFKDADHLNMLGSVKFTHYFGQYAQEELGLVPREYTQEVINNFDLAYSTTKDYLEGIEADLKKKAGK